MKAPYKVLLPTEQLAAMRRLPAVDWNAVIVIAVRQKLKVMRQVGKPVTIEQRVAEKPVVQRDGLRRSAPVPSPEEIAERAAAIRAAR